MPPLHGAPPAGNETLIANTSRRRVLKAVSAALAEIGLFSLPLTALADGQTPGGAQAASGGASDAAVPAPQAAGPVDVQQFLAVSKALTGHQDLNPQTASRILQAMRDDNAAFADKAAALAVLAKGTLAPNAYLEAATPLGLRDTALAIVAAWYTGTVGSGPRARLIAYKEALMYWPVRDGLTVPTYCTNGPLWFTAPPPAVGLSAPRALPQPRPKPPTPPVNRQA